jgi:2'-5' RNA ligase
MSPKVHKYSIWIRPKGLEGENIQSLISSLASEYHGPLFAPHITVVGTINSSKSEITNVQQKLEELGRSVGRFSVSLTKFGSLDEEYRSLYLLAESPMLAKVFEQSATFFPQVTAEHFKQMPHASLLYGNYSPKTKHEIIQENLSLVPLHFEVESFDLFKTDGPAHEWIKVSEAKLA